MADFRHITSADWSSKLNSFGDVVEGLDDVRQCIAIILTTQKGSLPHRVDFGCDIWQYLDLPAAEARPHIIREAVLAIKMWEPRVTVKSVNLKQLSPSHCVLTVTWMPVESASDAVVIRQEVRI